MPHTLKGRYKRSIVLVRNVLHFKYKASRFLFLLLFTLLTLLQTSYVQTHLLQWGADYFSQKTGHKTQLQSGVIDILFGKITLKGIAVRDTQDSLMIQAKEIEIYFNPLDLLGEKTIEIASASLTGADVRLITNPKSKELNIIDFITAIENLSPPSQTKDTTPSPAIVIKDIKINNAFFSYNDVAEDSLPQGEFDYFHFAFDDLGGDVRNFRIYEDTIEMNIAGLKALEKRSNLNIRRLDTHFIYTSKSMSFLGLKTLINESILGNHLAFHYDDIGDMSDFNNKVSIEANLKNAVIHSKDLALFAPTLKMYDEKVTVTGGMTGKVNRFETSDIALTFGKTSIVLGKLAFNGLPNIDETLIKVDLKKSVISAQDLRQYVSPQDFPLIEKLGLISFTGDFIGFPYDFVAKGVFQTYLGKVETDINLKVHQQTYKGKLKTQNFELGKWIGIPNEVGAVTMQGEIDGKGFKREDFDFTINAEIAQIGIMKYPYQSISVNGQFKDQYFDGIAKIQDPNLLVSGEGKINLKDSSFLFSASLKEVNLKPLGFSTQNISFACDVKADFVGLDVDKAEGSLGLYHGNLLYEDQSLSLDRIVLTSIINDKERQLCVDSDFLDLNAFGNFSFKEMGTKFSEAWSDYKAYLQNLPPSQRKKILQQQDTISKGFQYELWLKNVNPIVNMFVPDLRISDDGYLYGDVEYGRKVSFMFKGQIDSIEISGQKLYENKLRIGVSKHRDSVATETAIILHSSNQKLGGLATENLQLVTTMAGKHIDFNVAIEHADSDDEVRTKGTLLLQDTAMALTLYPPDIRLLNKKWTCPQNVEVSIKDNAINVLKDVILLNGSEKINISGKVSPNPDDILKIGIDSFDIGLFSGVSEMDLKGILDLKLELSHLYEKPFVDGKLLISNIEIQQQKVGTFESIVRWENDKNGLYMYAGLRQKKTDYLFIDGYFYPDAPKDQLDFEIQTIAAPLKIAEPFLMGQVKDIKGDIYGALKIKGTPEKPLVLGELFIHNGRLKVTYLNTTYHFDDKISFGKDYVLFDKFRLTDSEGNHAFLSGGLSHKYFDHFLVLLHGNMYRFKVLNTTEEENSTYYGNAFLSGDFAVSGAFEDLDIKINARTEQGTTFYMPLDSYAGVEEKEFIRFVEKDSTNEALVQTNTRQKLINASNFNMELNIEMTPDAYAEIIFDRKAGDIIRGNGQGKVKMQIDTKGEFRMFGGVEIVKGAYNFTFLNIINKEFGVKPGSIISWTGDPYGALLDITATYTQMASLVPIIALDSNLLNRPELRRKYPVQVELFLSGSLLRPDLKFDIDFIDYPATIVAGGFPVFIDSHVAAFKNKIHNDEQELNKQVFSLIVLKKLSTQNTLTGINQSASSSLSELLTNQLSYWMSQVDDNLEIDVDLNGLAQEALNTMQLRLSYSFFEGRMRITREGTFTDVQNQTTVRSVAGDWQLEYLIKPDGRLKVKVYHRNNMNNFNSALQNNSTDGASLLYLINFDSVWDIFEWKLNERRARKKKEVIILDNEILH